MHCYLHSDALVAVPHGIASLAAFMRDRYDVRLLDATAAGRHRHTRIDDKQFEYGLSSDQVMREIGRYQPDVIGYSCLFSHQMDFIRQLSKRVRNRWPGTFQVCGGGHPSFIPDRAGRDSALDVVVVGEGEETFRELLDAHNEGRDGRDIIGTVWLEDGIVVRRNAPRPLIEDLDHLPWPAYDLLDMESYFAANRPHGVFSHGRRTTQVITSRGCPLHCTFCSSARFWGRRLRLRNVEDVVDQIAYLVERYRADWIQFEDDNITHNRNHIESFCNALIRRRLPVHWSLPNGVAGATLNRPLLQLMHHAGCRDLTLAIESGSQETLRRTRKPLRVEQVHRVVREVREVGIGMTAYFIVGFPWETRADITATLGLARSMPWAAVFYATPLVGSQLAADMIEEGLIDEDHDFERDSYFISKSQNFGYSDAELSGLIKQIHLHNGFGHPRWMLGHLWTFGRLLLDHVPLRYLRQARHQVREWLSGECD
jgi:magnesium-protoporphyrin IX monomethyl ester (oxidative) cyclase